MKRRVLFVDDDPNVLEGLRHRLHRQRSQWEMLFVSSGKEALELLARSPVDVIVSDMRMPEMDGAALLERVRDRYPQVVRIVLSGQAELETTLRAVPVAHQFLTKPCAAGVIENVVARACSLQALISEEVLRQVVGRIDNLPTPPRVHAQLTAALTKESVTIGDVAHIVKQDMALCAKTLQLVNSGFFRMSRVIAQIEEAVAYLGFETIKQIVLAVEVFQQPEGKAPHRLSVAPLQAHAWQVANLAAGLIEDKARHADTFIAGLLHDIGKLVLVVELPQSLERVLQEMKRQGCPMHVAEQQVLGVTHAEVGAYLLGIWGLPYPIVEAVANHHAPGRVDAREFGILTATHLADALLHETASGEGKPALDEAHLQDLGLLGELPRWRAIAQQQLGGRDSLA